MDFYLDLGGHFRLSEVVAVKIFITFLQKSSFWGEP